MTTPGASATRDDDDVRIAQLCLDLGKPREAHRILARLVKEGDDAPETLLLLAQACVGIGATREGLDCARRVVAVRPDDAWAWRLVAAAASRNRDHEVALDAAKRAIALDPLNWRTHAERVEVDRISNRVTEDTWDAAQEAVALAPDEPGPYLTSALLAHGKGYLDGAKTFYREVLRVDPENQLARRYLARARLDSNDFAGATAEFSDMLGRDPGSRSIARSIRRAVLRTLEWVNGILLVGLILIGMLALLGYTEKGSPVTSALMILAVVLVVSGLAFAFARYRRGLGTGGTDFLRSLPRLSPGLLVLAAIQALALLSGVVVVATLVVSPTGAGLPTTIAGITAAAGVFVGLTYARIYHAAL